MTAIFSLLASLISSVPAFERLLQQFVNFYMDWQAKRNKSQFRDALRTAITTRDQRGLEDESISGQPSGYAGVKDRPREGGG